MSNLSSFFGGGSGSSVPTQLADEAVEFLLTGPNVSDTNTFFATPARKAGLATAIANTSHFVPIFETPQARASLLASAAAVEAVGQSEAALNTLIAASEYSKNFFFNGATPMGHLAASLNAMDAVVSNGTAIDVISQSQVAMDAMVASQIAMDAITASNIALGYVPYSALAMNTIAASQLAMDAIVASELARGVVAQSSTAMNSIAAATVGRNTVVASQAMMDSITVRVVALNAMFNALGARAAMFGSAIAEKSLRDSSVAMDHLTTNFGTALSSADVSGNIFASITNRSCFCLQANTGYSSTSGNRGARNFAHLQDGVTSASVTVPNSPNPGNPWPLLAGRMMSGLEILSRNNSTITYTRTATLVYMD